MLGCRTEIDVLAAEKEVYVVWGVLNPLKNEQFIKVTRVFQTDSDAILYAADQDLSIEGLEVFLHGNGKSLLAEEVRLERNAEGIFQGSHLVYRFQTQGADALVAGERYDLEIRKPDNAEFLISSFTTIPTSPLLRNPSGHVYNIDDQLYIYPTLNFDDDYVTYFKAGTGKGFELRVWVDYEENGEQKTARWGPTPIFTKPVNCGANALRGELCYEIPAKAVPNAFKAVFQNGNNIQLHDSIKVSHYLDSLSRVIRFEVTAVDSFLTSFLYANAPFGYGLNLLMDKPQVSNISDEHIGIFGSIHPHHRYINFGGCAKYYAGLTSNPPSGCD